MGFDHKSYSRALKVLDTAPKAIEEAKRKYERELANIRAQDATRNYSPAFIDRKKSEAKAERDRVIKGLADSMIPAFEVVKTANSNYDAEDLQLDDPKLTNALRLLDAMGGNMDPATQVKILNQFRGNMAALRVLEGVFRKNGLYFSGMAHEMQTPIKNQTLEEMEQGLATYAYNLKKGVVDFDINKYSFWSKGDFAKQSQRMGYSEDGDPYIYALAEMQNGLEAAFFSNDAQDKAVLNSQKLAIEKAARDIAVAKQDGNDVAPIFDKAIQSITRLSESSKPNPSGDAQSVNAEI